MHFVQAESKRVIFVLLRVQNFIGVQDSAVKRIEEDEEVPSPYSKPHASKDQNEIEQKEHKVKQIHSVTRHCKDHQQAKSFTFSHKDQQNDLYQ
jgi:hypothetical protein